MCVQGTQKPCLLFISVDVSTEAPGVNAHGFLAFPGPPGPSGLLSSQTPTSPISLGSRVL